ncbi:MAG: hypothetical protein ACK5LC_05415 [Coprobacillaceae bacterium]
MKLYSTSILPLLGLILNEYREDVCNKQNLQYDHNAYHTGNNVPAGNLLQVLSNKLAIIITTIVCVSTIIVAVNVFQNPFVDGEAEINTPIIEDLGMFNKSKEHPYIYDITYLGFPMRTNIDIHIDLKKDVIKEDIKILFNDEELSFEKHDKDILVQVSENGIYTIITKESKTFFKISNIDTYAPELVRGFSENGYLQLVVNDELSKIDYEKSFVEYQGKEYIIPKDLKIKGEFSSKVKVTIYHLNGYKIIYDLDF